MASTSQQGTTPSAQNAASKPPKPIAWLVSVDGGISDTPMYPDGLVVGRNYTRGLQQLQRLGHRAVPFFEFPESGLNDVHCMLLVSQLPGIQQDSPVSTPRSPKSQYQVTLCNMSDHIILVNDLQLAPEQHVTLEDGDWVCLTQGGDDGQEEDGIEMQFRFASNGSCTPTPSSPTATPSVSLTPSSTAYTTSSHHPSAGQTPHHAAANPFSSSQRNAPMPADRFQAVADLFIDNLPYCPLCQGLLDAAVQLQPCGHAFCATCLSHELGAQLQSAAMALSCPLGCPCPQLVVSAIRQRVRVNTFLLHGSPPVRNAGIAPTQPTLQPLQQPSGESSEHDSSISPISSVDSRESEELSAPVVPLVANRGSSMTPLPGGAAAAAAAAAPRGNPHVRPVNSAPHPSTSSHPRPGVQNGGPVQPAAERPPADPDLPLLDLILRWAQDYAYLQSAGPSQSPQSRQASTIETESALGGRESDSETPSMGSSPRWPTHTESALRNDRSDAEPSLQLGGVRESEDLGSVHHSVTGPDSRAASVELPSSSWPQPVRVIAVTSQETSLICPSERCDHSGQQQQQQHGNSPVFTSSSVASSAIQNTLEHLAQQGHASMQSQGSTGAQHSPLVQGRHVAHARARAQHLAQHGHEGAPDALLHDSAPLSSYHCSPASHCVPSPAEAHASPSSSRRGPQSHVSASPPGNRTNVILEGNAYLSHSHSMHSTGAGHCDGDTMPHQPASTPVTHQDTGRVGVESPTSNRRRSRQTRPYSHPTSPHATPHHYLQHTPHGGPRPAVGTPDRMQGSSSRSTAPVHSLLSAMQSCLAGHTTYRLSPGATELQQMPTGLRSPGTSTLPFAARGLDSPSSSRSTHSYTQPSPRHRNLAAEIASALIPLSPGWERNGPMPRTNLTALGIQYNSTWHEQTGPHAPDHRRRSVCLSDLGTPRTLLAAATQLLHPTSPVPLSPAAAVAVAAASLASVSPGGGPARYNSSGSSHSNDMPQRPCACNSPHRHNITSPCPQLPSQPHETAGADGEGSSGGGLSRLHMRWLHMLQTATEDESSPDSHSHMPHSQHHLLPDGDHSPHATARPQACESPPQARALSPGGRALSPGAVLDGDTPPHTPPRRMAYDGTTGLHLSRHAVGQDASSVRLGPGDARAHRRCTRDSLPNAASPHSHSYHTQRHQDHRSVLPQRSQQDLSRQASSTDASGETESEDGGEEGGEEYDSPRSSTEGAAMFKAPHSMHVLCELHDFRLPMDLVNWRASLVDRILLQLRVAVGPPAGPLSVSAMVRTLEMMARLAWASPDIKDALATGGAIPKLIAVLNLAAGTAPTSTGVAPAGQAPGPSAAAAVAAGYGSRTSAMAAGPPAPTTIAGAAAARGAAQQPQAPAAGTAPAAPAAAAAVAPATGAASEATSGATSQGASSCQGNAAVAAAGCMAMASLVVGAGDVCLTNQWDIAKALGVEAVAAIMAAHPQETVVQLAALMAFSPLATNNPMMQANICQAALPVILAALRDHPGAAAVQAKGMVLLGVMVQGEEALLDAVRTCMLEAHVEQLVMAAMQRHGMTADAVLWPCLFATNLLLADGRMQLARHTLAKQRGLTTAIRECTEAHMQRSVSSGQPEDGLIMGTGLRVLHILEDEHAQLFRRRLVCWLGALTAATMLGAYKLYAWRRDSSSATQGHASLTLTTAGSSVSSASASVVAS